VTGFADDGRDAADGAMAGGVATGREAGRGGAGADTACPAPNGVVAPVDPDVDAEPGGEEWLAAGRAAAGVSGAGVRAGGPDFVATAGDAGPASDAGGASPAAGGVDVVRSPGGAAAAAAGTVAGGLVPTWVVMCGAVVVGLAGVERAGGGAGGPSDAEGAADADGLGGPELDPDDTDGSGGPELDTDDAEGFPGPELDPDDATAGGSGPGVPGGAWAVEAGGPATP